MQDNQDRCEIWAVDKDKSSRAVEDLPGNYITSSLAEVFKALADQNRVKILFCLMNYEMCVCELACVLNISEPATSQHLRILRTLRLVKQRKQGRMVYYSLDDEHVRHLLNVCVEHVGHL